MLVRLCPPARAIGLVLALAPALRGGRAEAQFLPGIGWFNPYNNTVPSPTEFLYQRSISAAGANQAPPVVDDSNLYYNKLHDTGLDVRSDIADRRAIASGIARTNYPPPGRPQPRQPSAKTAPTVARPVLPLASFFDRYRKLVWPADAPMAGDLAQKRSLSDQATVGVLGEVEAHGRAQVASAASARKTLIAYGRPALDYLTRASTPRVADGFHLFLMSLYESLGQATEGPPKGS